MVRFKYNKGNFEFWDADDFLDFSQVENPIQIDGLPDGEYMVRGIKKFHHKRYVKNGNKWYLLEDVVKDNGHFICNATHYNLFPSLSKPEWDNIGRVLNKLKPIWVRYYYAYKHWEELRSLGREVRLNFVKDIK